MKLQKHSKDDDALHEVAPIHKSMEHSNPLFPLGEIQDIELCLGGINQSTTFPPS